MKVSRYVQNLSKGCEFIYKISPDYAGSRIDGILELETISIKELSGFAGISDDIYKKMDDVFIFSNGWQSWSPGWEMGPGESIKSSLLGALDTYIKRPLGKNKKNQITSSFFTWIRKDNHYLAVISTMRGGAPIGFKINRKKGNMTIDAFANGKKYETDEIVAKLAVIDVTGFLNLKAEFASIFQKEQNFEQLRFLNPASPNKTIPGGYGSWYNRYQFIDEKAMLEDLDGILSAPNLIKDLYLKNGKQAIFQIDDGWQKAVGDWRVDEKRFPNGMKFLADQIKNNGFIPGIWFAPFLVPQGCPNFSEKKEWLLKDNSGKLVVAGWMPKWKGNFYSLDLSRKDVLQWLDDLMGMAIDEWGFRYIKLDFLYAGMIPGNYTNPGATFEIYANALKTLTRRTTNSKGDKVAYLGCGAPLEPSYPFLPLMRIGCDTKEEWDDSLLAFLRYQGRPSAKLSLRDTIGRSILDNTVFISDPDVIFCRDSNIKLTHTEKELIAVVNFLFASQIMISDDFPSSDGESVKKLTNDLVRLYNLFEDKNIYAYRLSGYTDLYQAESSDHSIRGIINLGNSNVVMQKEKNIGESILLNGKIEKDTVIFNRRSASFFYNVTN